MKRGYVFLVNTVFSLPVLFGLLAYTTPIQVRAHEIGYGIGLLNRAWWLQFKPVWIVAIPLAGILGLGLYRFAVAMVSAKRSLFFLKCSELLSGSCTVQSSVFLTSFTRIRLTELWALSV